MTNVDPPEDIPSWRRSEFRGRYGDCVEQRIQEFTEAREESYRERLRQNIREDKRHRELLNLCIYPFFQFQPLGYEFIRADPLEELDVPNFDFLLFDFDGHAIFGEVKGSVGSGYASNYVNEVVEQKEVVEEHEEYIKDRYTGEPIDHVEYVLAVYSPDADDVSREVISRRENIVTWGVHQMEKKITVNTVAPDPEDWPEDPEEVHSLLQHDHNSLNSEVAKYNSSTECLDLFPKSHPVTTMRSLITARHKEGGHCFVNESNLQDTVRESLFYLSEDECNSIKSEVIELAKSINFLREREGDEGDYKLISRYTHSEGLEKTLKRKWVDSRVEARKDEIKNECWEDVRETMLEEDDAQTSLGDFF